MRKTKRKELPQRISLKPDLSFSSDDLFPLGLLCLFTGTFVLVFWASGSFWTLFSPFIVTRLVAYLVESFDHRREVLEYGHCLARECSFGGNLND